MDNLKDVIQYLRGVKQRNCFDNNGYELAKAILNEEKELDVELNRQADAKDIWCLERILDIQHQFAEAFNEIESGEYYRGWCTLEIVEINIEFLERHFDIENDSFYIASILRHTEQFQSLFPYSLFTSPGMIHKKKSCSTCGRPISIRNSCGHIKGEIYDGEMCCHIIEKADLIEISLVTNPVQKCSVVWLHSDGKSIDHYDYSNVAYVAAGLRRPFDGWNLQYTQIRENHSQYKHVSRNDKCPCGSNIKYKNCCLKKRWSLETTCQNII